MVIDHQTSYLVVTLCHQFSHASLFFSLTTSHPPLHLPILLVVVEDCSFGELTDQLTYIHFARGTSPFPPAQHWTRRSLLTHITQATTTQSFNPRVATICRPSLIVSIERSIFRVVQSRFFCLAGLFLHPSWRSSTLKMDNSSSR